MKSSLRIAWWWLSFSWRDFLFFAGAMALSVALLVGTLSLSSGLRESVNQQAGAMLAADLRLESAAPWDEEVLARLRRPGRTLAPMMEFTANLHVPATDRWLLVEVKAVSPAYPLRGALLLHDGQTLVEALENHGAVAESALARRLDLAPGAEIVLGQAHLRLSALLEQEPDRVTSLFSLGPRLFIPLSRVAESGLLQQGSRIKQILLVRLGEDESPEAVAEEMKEFLGQKGIHLLTPTDNNPSAQRFMRRFTLFLFFAAQLTLLIATTGIAGSMAALMRENRTAVAILHALGAERRMVHTLFLWQILLMGGVGSGVGALLGTLLPQGLLPLVGDLFPNASLAGFSWGWLGGGVLFGLVLSWLMALAPLQVARSVAPGFLFRTNQWRDALAFSRRGVWGAGLGLILLLGGLFVVMGAWQWGAILLGSCLVVGGGMGGVVWLCFALLDRLHPRSFIWLLALRRISPPQQRNYGLILSLGLGIGAVMTLLFLERAWVGELSDRLAERSPSFFFIDLQSDQVEEFTAWLQPLAAPGSLRMVPVVRGRVTQLGELPVSPRMAAQLAEPWRLEREYVLTWSADQPANNPLLAGSWWGEGERCLSVESGMARALNLAVGQEIGFDIQGRLIRGPICNIRQVRWTDMGLNFFVIFSPAILADAPATHLASVVVAVGDELPLLQEIHQRWPNVTAIPSREVMESVRSLLLRLAGVIHWVGLTGMGAGLLVLGANVAASRRRYARESAICRLLGADRQQMVGATVVEFFLVGTLSAGVGLLLAGSLTALVTYWMVQERWTGEPWLALMAWGGAVVLVVGVGSLGSWRESRRPVLDILRRRQ